MAGGVFVAVVSMLGFSASAIAQSSNDLVPPFSLGETWYICQGYNTPSISHDGNDEHALDLVLDSAQKGPTGCDASNLSAGRAVYAPVNGTVFYSSPDQGSVCINRSSAGSVMLAHLQSRIPAGSRVTKGTRIGTVAPRWSSENPSAVAHVHIQAHSSANCQYKLNGTVPFDSGNGFRFCDNVSLSYRGANELYQWRLTTLRTTVGCFNGRGNLINDVFQASGSSWQVRYGGTGSWQTLANSAATMPLALGDFNHDGVDDVFQATGTKWQVRYGGTGSWQTLADSGATLNSLLVGDFE